MDYAWVTELDDKEAGLLASFMLNVKKDSYVYPRIDGFVQAIGWKIGKSKKGDAVKMLKERVESINEAFAAGPKEWKRVLLDAYNIASCRPYSLAKREGICPVIQWDAFSRINNIRFAMENGTAELTVQRRRGRQRDDDEATILQIPDRFYYMSDYSWDESPEGQKAWATINAGIDGAVSKAHEKYIAERAALEAAVPRTITPMTGLGGTGYYPIWGTLSSEPYGASFATPEYYAYRTEWATATSPPASPLAQEQGQEERNGRGIRMAVYQEDPATPPPSIDMQEVLAILEDSEEGEGDNNG